MVQNRNNKGSVLLAAIILVSAISVAAAAMLSGSHSGSKFYAPSTWFSHKEADKTDKAKSKDDKAGQVVSTARDEVLHTAVIEADKANRSAQSLPSSQEAGVVQRFTLNTFGLLNRISPLTPNELDQNTSILLGLLSKEVAKREQAEALQAQSDKDRLKVSSDLQMAVKAKETASKELAAAQLNLRSAYDRENGLADELRAQTARHYILIVICALALVAVVYLRIVASKFGSTLHLATQILPQDKAERIISSASSELGMVGQWLVRTGREAAKKSHDKAMEIIQSHKDE